MVFGLWADYSLAMAQGLGYFPNIAAFMITDRYGGNGHEKQKKWLLKERWLDTHRDLGGNAGFFHQGYNVIAELFHWITGV